MAGEDNGMAWLFAAIVLPPFTHLRKLMKNGKYNGISKKFKYALMVIEIYAALYSGQVKWKTLRDLSLPCSSSQLKFFFLFNPLSPT